MSDVVVALLSLCWIPTVYGFFRAWSRYLRVRAYTSDPRATWLWQLIAVIATLATPVVVYISLLSANRWLGNAPIESPIVMIGGTVAAFIIAFIVPVIEIRVEMWSRGVVPAPVPPPPPAKGTNGPTV